MSKLFSHGTVVMVPSKNQTCKNSNKNQKKKKKKLSTTYLQHKFLKVHFKKILPHWQIKSTVRLCRRIKHRGRQI